VTELGDRISDATAKIKRAEKHIRELDIERAAFLASDPYAAVPEYYVKQDATIYFLDKWEPIQDNLSLIAGDAIHNLRSALDYLIFQVIAGPGKASDHSAFPILKTWIRPRFCTLI
jgi:hypothetical protein